jgi:hypothetical protein
MVRSQNQNVGISHSIKIYNSSFERLEKVKFLRATLKNQNSNQEENHSTLQSGNAPCHSVKNLLSSSLLPKNIKINLQRNVIFSVLNECENWSLTLKEERMASVLTEKGAEEYI